MAKRPEQPNLVSLPRPTGPPEADAWDVRARRPYVFTRRLLGSGLRRLLSISCLLAIDVAAVGLAVYCTLVLKELYLGHTPILWGVLWRSQVEWLPFLALVTALVFGRAGLYSSRETRPGFSRILSSLALVTLVTLAFALATNQPIATGSVFVISFLLASLAVGLLRWSYDSVTRELLRGVGATRLALLYGSGPRLASLRRTFERDDGDIRYEFLAVAGDATELKAALARHRPDEILVDGNQLDEEDLVQLLDTAYARGIKVRVAPTTAELLTHHATYVPGQAVPLFELRPPTLAGFDWALKRTFDLVVSVLVLVVGSPLWLLIAAAVKATSAGPILYRDGRVGVGERQFGMFKFRTMHADAPDRQVELEPLNEADGALFKLRRDPRVTSVGRLLRRFSLDELPNMLNVLRGEMSLVGPRPLPLRDFRHLEPWHRKRYLVLPGMTGLWQISGRSNLSFDDLVRLDFYYLENWSVWLDVSILIKTVPAVLFRRGAY